MNPQYTPPRSPSGTPASAARGPLGWVADGGGAVPQEARSLAERPPARRWAPETYALLSALIPGAGQGAQGRWGAALAHGATVASYLAAAVAVGGGRAFWLALGWNVWSAVDAYRHERD